MPIFFSHFFIIPILNEALSEDEPKKWMISEVVKFFIQPKFLPDKLYGWKKTWAKTFFIFFQFKVILRVTHFLNFWSKNGTRRVQCWISRPIDNVQTCPIRLMKGIIQGFQWKKRYLGYLDWFARNQRFKFCEWFRSELPCLGHPDFELQICWNIHVWALVGQITGPCSAPK